MIEFNPDFKYQLNDKKIDVTIRMSFAGLKKFREDPSFKTDVVGHQVCYSVSIQDPKFVVIYLRTDPANATRLKLQYDKT